MPTAATSNSFLPLPHLPYEVWEMILDLLDKTEDLLAFQRVCTDWREVLLSYVMDGRLKSRALVSNIISFFLALANWFGYRQLY